MPVLATHTPPEDRAEVFRAQGRPTPTLHELDPSAAATFRESIARLREANPFAASVYVYDEDEYRGMRLLITDDGRAGVALKDDPEDGAEIVSLFVRPDSEYQGGARSILATAVALGGRRLDCFDTVLPKLYAREGFVPVARLAWSDEHAPDGWDSAVYREYSDGRPDVVFMAYDPAKVDSTYNRRGGSPVSSYDEGEAAARAVAARAGERSTPDSTL